LQVLHDGMLLMDRAAAAGALAVDGPAAPLAAAACLMLACQHQGELLRLLSMHSFSSLRRLTRM
jgi:hypothetical protein